MITKLSNDISFFKKIINMFNMIELYSFFIILPILRLKFEIEFPFTLKLDIKDFRIKLDVIRGVISVISANVILLIYEVFKAMLNLICEYSLMCAYTRFEINFTIKKVINKIQMDFSNPFLYSTRTVGLLE